MAQVARGPLNESFECSRRFFAGQRKRSHLLRAASGRRRTRQGVNPTPRCSNNWWSIAVGSRSRSPLSRHRLAVRFGQAAP